MSESSGSRSSLGRTAFELKSLWQSESRLCPICRFVRATIEHYIDNLFYERVNDPPTRDAVRNAGGFCRYHAGLIAQQADALGTAIMLEDVLKTDLRALQQGAYDRPASSANPIARLLGTASSNQMPPAQLECPPCPICDAERGMDELGVDGLLQGLVDSDFAAIFSRSDGLCMQHFRLTFDRCHDESRWAEVLETQQRALEGLTGELAELARKHDYRFRDEPKGEEMRSWQRALNATSRWVDE